MSIMELLLLFAPPFAITLTDPYYRNDDVPGIVVSGRHACASHGVVII